MTLPFTPKVGQIVLFERQGGLFRDPSGSFITGQEGDSNICHAALVGDDSKGCFLWTTGASHKFFYGRVNLEEYLVGKKYHVAEFDALLPGQASIMNATCQAFTGQFYGFHKVFLLMLKSRFGGVVRRLYPWLTKTIKHPFCSEAVAAACWKAGFRVCEEDGKEEPSAITPVDLYYWIEKKGTPIKRFFSSLLLER